MPVVNFHIKNVGGLPFRDVKETWSIPEKWDDLTPNEILDVFPLVAEKNWLSILHRLLPKEVAEHCPAAKYQGLIPHLKWMEKAKMFSPPFSFFEFSKAELDIEGIEFYTDSGNRNEHFYLPGASLYNIKMMEMEMGYSHFANFVNSQDPKHLNSLIAVFCRPKNPEFGAFKYDSNSDVRMPFNPLISRAIAPKFEKLSDGIKASFLHFFMSCLEGIYNAKPYRPLFPKPKKIEPEEEAVSVKLDPKQWVDFVRNVAKLNIMGSTIDEVREKYFHEILQVAAKEKEEAKQREEDENRKNTTA